MQHKICLITGANSGIGKETAIALAKKGTTVIMICRDRSRGEAARREIVAKSNNETVDLLIADMSSQQSIREVATEFQSKYDALHILVNNAGAAFGKRQESVDGIELTFALNHLGYFLLTDLLLNTLKASAPARIVNVASDAHRGMALDFDNLQMKKKYATLRAYSASKLANILFTYELDRRLNGMDERVDSGITVNALHPGVVRTNIWGGVIPLLGPVIKFIGHFVMRTPAEGAATSIYLASSPDVEGVSGKYFVDCQPTRSAKASCEEETAQRLWEVSAELCS